MNATDTQERDSEASDTRVPHSFYHPVSRRSYSDQRGVTEAWVSGAYPTHNADDGEAVLYTGSPDDPDAVVVGRDTNFHGVQRPDGSGVLWHYDTREAIRLTNGIIIDNSQCWATGFAHCSSPHDSHYELPLDAVEAIMDDGDSWEQMCGVVGQDSDPDEWNHVAGSVVDFGTYGVYVGRDPSIINGDGKMVFRVDGRLLGHAKAEGTGSMLERALTPEAVSASGLDVVDSAEYVKSRLDSDEHKAHVDAGGKMVESESRYSDHFINPLHYRADLQGEVVVRHGEWFFIPMPDLDPQQLGVSDASHILDNHQPVRDGGMVMPYPTECEACASTSFELFDGREAECRECGFNFERPIYVRGEVRHLDGDHNAVNLGDTWHRAVTHDRDVLIYDPNPGRDDARRSTARGRGRRGGRRRWD